MTDALSFRNYLSRVRQQLTDAENAYAEYVGHGMPSGEELFAALGHASDLLSLAASKASADAALVDAAKRTELDPAQFDETGMWDAIAADVEDGLVDVGTLADPDPSLSLGEATQAAEWRLGIWDCNPQTDREDRTADDHDEWVRDWRRAADEGDDK